MKVTMESTNKMAIINGLNFRVWQGTLPNGTRFVALIKRMAAVTVPEQTILIAETVKPHKDLDPALVPALATLDPLAFPAEPKSEAEGA
jgi:hypothetical protein